MNDIWDVWPWAAAGLVSAIVTVAVCKFQHARAMNELRKRLLQSEHLRQAELERAKQARTQIAQLTQWVTDLQKRLPQESAVQLAQARRARVEKLVPELADSGAPSLPPNGFADTMPLARAAELRR